MPTPPATNSTNAIRKTSVFQPALRGSTASSTWAPFHEFAAARARGGTPSVRDRPQLFKPVSVSGHMTSSANNRSLGAARVGWRAADGANIAGQLTQLAQLTSRRETRPRLTACVSPRSAATAGDRAPRSTSSRRRARAVAANRCGTSGCVVIDEDLLLDAVFAVNEAGTPAHADNVRDALATSDSKSAGRPPRRPSGVAVCSKHGSPTTCRRVRR